jgi:hypothetical protein
VRIGCIANVEKKNAGALTAGDRSARRDAGSARKLLRPAPVKFSVELVAYDHVTPPGAADPPLWIFVAEHFDHLDHGCGPGVAEPFHADQRADR